MEFLAYARVLRRRWPLIVLLAVVAGVSAFGYASRAPRVYRATAQLSVTPSIVEYWTGQAVERLLNNYALQLKTRDFARTIAAQLTPPESPDGVAGKVRAVAAPADFRISIEVDDADPDRAQRIANGAAISFARKIQSEIAGKERHDLQVEVMESAELPDAPFSPRPRRDALGAAILGAILGVAVAFLLEFWDDTVKSVEEATAILGVPVLGAIPDPNKTGVFHDLIRGRWPGRPAGRDRLHKAPFAGRGGVPDAPH